MNRGNNNLPEIQHKTLRTALRSPRKDTHKCTSKEVTLISLLPTFPPPHVVPLKER